MGLSGNVSFLPTPLCPAGHLPLKGGDQTSAAPKLPISPLEGEMAGRPEGGGRLTPARWSDTP
jgi:assimilatory nitrate reductase catalytic subunit/cobaltochelatase CobN